MNNQQKTSFTVYNDLAEIKSLKPQYEALLSQSKSDGFFLSWEWIYTWCEFFSAKYQLYFIIGYNGAGETILFAPLKIRRERRILGVYFQTLEFIGWGESVTPEHLDIVIKDGIETVVLEKFVNFLSQIESINAIELKPFSPHSGNLRIIERLFKKNTGWTQKSKYSQSPYVKLPESWEEYFRQKSKNFKKKMREYERLCHRDLNFSLHICDNIDELKDFFSYLTQLHNSRWQGKSTSFFSENTRNFHFRLMERLIMKGRLNLLIAFDKDRPIAALYCYKYGRVFYYYQSGRDITYNKYRLGLVLINNAIRMAIEEKIEVFDFLTGCEQYKFRWAENVNTNYCLTFYKSTIAFFAHRFPYMLRSILKSIYKITLKPYLKSEV